MEETVGPVSTFGRELLRGWRRPIGLMVSFMIFTASVWKLLDQPMYNQVLSMVTNRAWQEIIWIVPKKLQKLLRWLAPLTFLIRIQAVQDPLRGELPHVQIFMNDGPNPLTWQPSCSATDLADIWWSSNISSWIWSIISGVVTVLCHPGWGESQVEKSPHLDWATQFLTVAYDGACSPNVSFRIAWISFKALPCRKKNLMTAHVLMFF